MSTLHAIVLGIIQGLSEFLPISSSGHLAIAQWALGWDDFGDDQTLEQAFAVAVHLGTLAAVVTYFFGDLKRLARGALGSLARRRLDEQGRLAYLLLLTTVPAAVVGAAFSDTFASLDEKIGLVAVMLIVFGLVLAWADRQNGSREGRDWNVRDALAMGVGQALALQPGVSRSGVTMTVGLGLGYRRDEAARLAFLMSIPVIAGAGVFSWLEVSSGSGVPAEMRSAFLWGFASSAATGWFAIWLTLRIVRSATFLPFVVYRVGLGAIVLIAWSFGLR